MKYFAFINGLKGPEGQFFPEVPMSGEGKQKYKYLFGPVQVEDELTLNEAILKFKDKAS